MFSRLGLETSKYAHVLWNIREKESAYNPESMRCFDTLRCATYRLVPLGFVQHGSNPLRIFCQLIATSSQFHSRPQSIALCKPTSNVQNSTPAFGQGTCLTRSFWLLVVPLLLTDLVRLRVHEFRAQLRLRS